MAKLSLDCGSSTTDAELVNIIETNIYRYLNILILLFYS